MFLFFKDLDQSKIFAHSYIYLILKGVFRPSKILFHNLPFPPTFPAVCLLTFTLWEPS